MRIHFKRTIFIRNNFKNDKMNENDRILDDILRILAEFIVLSRYWHNFRTNIIINWKNIGIENWNVKGNVL